MNWYFKTVWLPIQVMAGFVLALYLLGDVSVNWWMAFSVWFLIGPVGTGVGFHRLFAHRQFETWRPVELTLAFLGTLAAYGPVMYWVAQHQHHHKHADHEQDINSPARGFGHAFLWWRFTDTALKAVDIRNYCSLRAARDPALMFLSKHFTKIVYAYGLLTLAFGMDTFASAFLIPVFVEHLRVNVLNSLAHMKLPGSYRLFDSDDNSYNNAILGWLTFGFGWHNAHHANPRELVNTHRWWELDIEGLIGRLLSKS